MFLEPDSADRAGAYRDTFWAEMIGDVERSPSRMLNGEPNDSFTSGVVSLEKD